MNYGEKNDNALVKLAQAGDTLAETELLYRHKNLVKSIARNYFMAGGDSEDLIQEGTLGLYIAVREYSPDKAAAFPTFASLCIRRHIFDLLRKMRSQKNRALNESIPLIKYNEEGDEFDVGLIDTESNPEELFLRREDGDCFNARLKSELTEREYSALVLYLQGMSYAEIAEALSLTVKGVDNALQAMKRKLKKLMQRS